MSIADNEMDEIIGDFIAESSESLESLDQKFMDLEKNPADTKLLNDIFRSVHTIKGAAGFLGFQQMVEVSHVTEDILNKLRKSEMSVDASIMDAILQAVDLIKVLLNNIREKNGRQEDIAPVLDLLGRVLQGAVAPAVQVVPQPVAQAVIDLEPAVAVADVEAAVIDNSIPQAEAVTQAPAMKPEAEAQQPRPQGPKADEGGPAKDKEQSIRVDLDRLDAVLNLAGELVLSRNRLVRLGGKLSEWDSENQMISQLDEAISQLGLVTTDIQLAVMKMRMQPVAKVFNKFPRMVRDLARQTGKEVELRISGEETELDKTVIEEIGDPLVHLVRNSIDHAMEDPMDRVVAGKPRCGTIMLNAYQEGRHIVVSVSDDGKGIDHEKIRRSAVEKGLISSDEADRMSVKDALNLIFIPGFSTAKQVSNISGRGVGMDVVKTNISKINGIISIDSEVGRGTTILFRLPLTLAIIQALTVEANGELFGIPLSTVIENIRVTGDEIKTIEGKEVIHIRGKVYPVIRLGSLVSDSGNKGSAQWKYIVILGIGEKQIGILVDRLHGQEEIVLKSMGEYLRGTEGISGACINGDGNVILVLDVAGLVESANMMCAY